MKDRPAAIARSVLVTLKLELLARLPAAARLPAVYAYRFFATAGGLVWYGLDLPDQYRRAASYVDLKKAQRNMSDAKFGVVRDAFGDYTTFSGAVRGRSSAGAS
jgi:hypothetical protein